MESMNLTYVVTVAFGVLDLWVVLGFIVDEPPL
jgi:hypothetical protein